MLKIQYTLVLFAVAALSSSALAGNRQSPADKKMHAQLIARQDAMQECVTLRAEGKKNEARKKLAAIVAKNPSMGITAEVMRLEWLAADDPKAWDKKVVSIAKSGDDKKRNTLGDFTWSEVCSPTGSKAVAKKAIKLALNSTDHKNVIVLFWAVMVYNKTKDYQAGLDSVTELFKILPTSSQKNNSSLIKQMEEKRTELEAKVKTKN